MEKRMQCVRPGGQLAGRARIVLFQLGADAATARKGKPHASKPLTRLPVSARGQAASLETTSEDWSSVLDAL